MLRAASKPYVLAPCAPAAWMTRAPAEVEETDRQALRDAGFDERDILDIANVAAFFNMTNRVSTALDRMPNPEYHAKAR